MGGGPLDSVPSKVSSESPSHTSNELVASSTDVAAAPAQALASPPPNADAGMQAGQIEPRREIAVTPGSLRPAGEAAAAPSSPVGRPFARIVRPNDERFRVRYVDYDGGAGPQQRPIIMQNTNGPCPLLAVCNALLLRGRLTLPPQTASIALADLLARVTELALALAPSALHLRSTYEVTLATVLDILPSIAAGLDVNVQFADVDKFEFTPSLSVFDLFAIGLLHGWLPDPQEPVFPALRGSSFNEAQLMPLAVPPKYSEGVVAAVQAWLEEHASQLTYTGLCRLHDFTQANQLYVLLHNNHFQVITKHQGRLFALVTDEGFAETQIVWETLGVAGDVQYVNSRFTLPAADSIYVPTAMDTAYPPQAAPATGGPLVSSDAELAMQLQREEEYQAQLQAQQQHLREQEEALRQVEAQRAAQPAIRQGQQHAPRPAAHAGYQAEMHARARQAQTGKDKDCGIL